MTRLLLATALRLEAHALRAARPRPSPDRRIRAAPAEDAAAARPPDLRPTTRPATRPAGRATDPGWADEAVSVVRTGMGVRRTGAAARRLPDFDVLVVAGFGGGLVEGFAAGELVVASEVRFGGAVHRCPGADRLAALLPAPVRTGAVVTGGHVVSGAERGRLAATGAVAADMESGPLVAEAVARGRPFAVVRAVVDSPERPLLRPATLHTGAVAYRRLRALRPLLVQWAHEGARPETRR